MIIIVRKQLKSKKPMNIIINTLLLLIGVSLCVLAWMINNNKFLNIQLNNSYLFIIIGSLFAFLGLGYAILEYLSFPVNKTLKWVSLGLLVLSIFIIITILILYHKLSYQPHDLPPNRYFKFDTFETSIQMTRWWKTLNIMAITGLLMLPTSLILSIINWIRAVLFK